jgi:hypothetical protein
MPKTKTSKTHTRTTADLIVQHSHKHLKQDTRTKLWTYLPNLTQIFSPLMFAFAGIVVMLSAFYIVNSVDVEQSAIMAENATDYVAQRDFYTNYSTAEIEELHAAAMAKFKIREAAIAVKFSKILNLIAFLFVIGGIWYLHKQHDIFGKNNAGFIVRRIR